MRAGPLLNLYVGGVRGNHVAVLWARIKLKTIVRVPHAVMACGEVLDVVAREVSVSGQPDLAQATPRAEEEDHVPEHLYSTASWDSRDSQFHLCS